MQRFFKFFVLSLFLKALIGVILPLSSDEAYYWFWGQNLQLSYYDHPGMVGWLYWLGSFIDHGFGLIHIHAQFVRLPAILLSQCTLYVWYLILKKYLNENELILWLIFATLSPLWGLGSIIVTPDTPVMLFWSLGVYYLLKICEENHTQRQLDWYYTALGASLGLGFCSKYHIVLFVPIALTYVLFERRWSVLQVRGLLFCTLSGLVFSLPVLLWNTWNDLASFRFQLDHGLGSHDEWTIRWFIEYGVGQLFIIFPTVVYACLRKPKQKDLRPLLYFAWGPILFFALTSLRSRVEANWPTVAYPALVALGFLVLKHSRAYKWTVGIWATAWALLLLQVFFPWIPVNERDLKTYEIKKYDSLIPYFEKNPDMLYASSYQMASMISYKTRFSSPHFLYKLRSMSRVDFYDFVAGSTPPAEKPFNMIMEREQHLSPDLLELNYLEVGSDRINDDFRIGHISRAPAVHASLGK